MLLGYLGGVSFWLMSKGSFAGRCFRCDIGFRCLYWGWWREGKHSTLKDLVKYKVWSPESDHGIEMELKDMSSAFKFSERWILLSFEDEGGLRVFHCSSCLTIIRVPLQSPPMMLMFLSSIIGVPIFNFNSWGGIRTKLSVLRYSVGYRSSTSPPSCPCGMASSWLVYVVVYPRSILITFALITSADVFSISDSSGTLTVSSPILRSQSANVDTSSFSASDKSLGLGIPSDMEATYVEAASFKLPSHSVSSPNRPIASHVARHPDGCMTSGQLNTYLFVVGAANTYDGKCALFGVIRAAIRSVPFEMYLQSSCVPSSVVNKAIVVHP
uniref:Uncharacterized protein n=1 Tax=Tanacetum cinerariifolium TaxID=118510 RepID=A0A699GUH8_TANCI|nr:hypothetical protein [Tanacetum cinerariifolium]